MKNKLCYLVDIIENNEECVILKVKDNKTFDLIKLGCFDGNEELIRLTKGEDHTCTIFRTNDKPFSWHWGINGYTLVSDNVSTMGKLIEACITEDFDIYIGEDKDKIKETMNIMSLEDSKDNSHFIKMMYWKDGNDVSVHKDNSFYKFFKNTSDAKEHFKNLNYDINFRNTYIASTGCIVEEYDISKNKELEDWKEEPYFLLLADLDKLNDVDSFTIARVIDGNNCVELHYVEGKATIEYGTRVKQDEWESIVEDIDWYNMDMTEEEISNKLWELFDYHYGDMKCSDKIYTICDDTLDVFNTKEEARRFYRRCYSMSEGAEQERYASILVDLNFSNIGKDNISTDCSEIKIKDNNESKNLSIQLEESLSIENAIKYYEEKIQPILEVSDDYNIDFNSSDPFVYFGSDAESYTNSSFSNYYKELLERFDVNVDSIYTDDWSDGKYKLVINNEEFKLTAWDSLDCVIDNVNSMIELLKTKDLGMEV